jgi:hypothetical protein
LNTILPVHPDLHLVITSGSDHNSHYPTDRLQKGLLLVHRGQDLTEEAVGFGLPVLKCGLQTLFPGAVDIKAIQPEPNWSLHAAYRLNLVERIRRRNTTLLNNRLFYNTKDILAALLRRVPSLRASLTALSSAARKLFGWETTYELAGFQAEIRLIYSLDSTSGTLQIKLDSGTRLPDSSSELVFMNEQGAHFFDRYEDSSGLRLSGTGIGCWDEVTGGRAGFSSPSRGVRFSVQQTQAARLFRGRELVGSRLAWAGFGYVIPCPAGEFEYSLQIEEMQ